jgi:predicted ATPase
MITKLHIANFKLLKNNDFDCKNLNILTGLNGMGKSTVLQALLLLRQSYKDNKISNLELKGDLCEIGFQEQAVTQKTDAKTIDIFFTIDNTKKYECVFQIDQKKTKSTIPIINILSENDLNDMPLFSNNFQYISAERIKPQTKHSYDNDIVETNNQISEIKGRCEYAVHYLAKKAESLINFEQLKYDNPNIKNTNLITQVSAWLGEISIGIKVEAKVDDKTKEVTLFYKYGVGDTYTEEFTPENVGFGVSYTLPIVVALLAAKKDSLILIENPEAHLHPKGQAKLAELMCLAAQNGVQIFCETHSDHIINGILVSVYEHYKDKRDNQDKLRGISNENVNITFFDRNATEHISEVITIKLSETGRFVDKKPTNFFDQIGIDAIRLSKK